MSTIDPALSSPLLPSFIPAPNVTEPSRVQRLLRRLHLQSHPEGGYYIETDRDTLRIPNPFRASNVGSDPRLANEMDDSTRSASTAIYYLLTPANPKGSFHRNRGRTVHTLHRGRGRYVIIHADEKEKGHTARIETFVVGHDIENGERLQWVVEGGKYKASFLLPDEDGRSESGGLLISEVSNNSLIMPA